MTKLPRNMRKRHWPARGVSKQHIGIAAHVRAFLRDVNGLAAGGSVHDAAVDHALDAFEDDAVLWACEDGV